MGNSSSSKQIRSDINFNEREWIVDSKPQNKQLGQYTTLKHIQTSELIDKYEVFFSSQEDYENYLESFKWRKRDPHIVRTYHYEPKQHKQFCSSVYSLIVYIYHPKGRLSDFRDIPYPDNLYCMMSMLDGYKKIYDKIGKFYLEEEQVCIDEQGQVKVWVNSDLSKNYPQLYEDAEDKVIHDEEAQMVEEIFFMVINNTDTSTQPQDIRFNEFLEQEKKHRRLTFQEGKAIVHDYAKVHKQNIPHAFQAFLKHIHPSFSEEQRQQENFIPLNLQKSKSIDQGSFKPQSFVHPHQVPASNFQRPLQMSHSVTPIHQPVQFIQSRPNLPYQVQYPQQVQQVQQLQQFPQRGNFGQIPPQQSLPRHNFSNAPPSPPPQFGQVVFSPRSPVFMRQNTRQNQFFSPQYSQNKFVQHPSTRLIHLPQQLPHQKIIEQPIQNQFMQNQSLKGSIQRQNEVKNLPYYRTEPKQEYKIDYKPEYKTEFREQDSDHLNINDSSDDEVNEEKVMMELMKLRDLQRNESEQKKYNNWGNNAYNSGKNSANLRGMHNFGSSSHKLNTFEKQSGFYHTLKDQRQIDPQIAADLLLYT